MGWDVLLLTPLVAVVALYYYDLFTSKDELFNGKDD